MSGPGGAYSCPRCPTTGNRESLCAIRMHMERYSKLGGRISGFPGDPRKSPRCQHCNALAVYSTWIDRRASPSSSLGAKTISAIEIGRRVGSEGRTFGSRRRSRRVPSLGVSRVRGQLVKDLLQSLFALLASQRTMLQ